MEQEAIAHELSNGIEKMGSLGAPAPGVEAVKAKPDSLVLSALVEKREKMLQGLNSVKSQREAVAQRLKELETSVSRTEGAFYTLEQLIGEIDPALLQQLQGG